MNVDVLLSAGIAGTCVALLIGCAGWVVRRYSSALANSLWRGALAALWLVLTVVLALEGLHAHPQSVCVPLLPGAAVDSAPAAIPPELVQPERAVAQLSTLRPDTGEAARPAPARGGGRSVLPAPGLLLVLVWAAGAVLGAVFLARDLYRTGALVRSSSLVTDPSTRGRVARWSRAVGLRRAPVVVRASGIPVPTVVGCVAPRLLLNGTGSLADAELNPVIVHELAHIRRSDLLVHLTARLTRVLWWWNPVTFIIARELRGTAEEACDDWAVSLTSKAGAYARVLVRWAEAARVAGGAACAEPGGMLVARVKRILRPGRRPRPDAPRWARTFLAACVGVAILSAATVSLRAAPDDLVLEDFSEVRTGRWAGGIEYAEGEDGQGLGHWFAARNGHHLELKDVPADWTPHKYIELWMWSAVANGQNVMLLVYTQGDDPNGMDYFSSQMVVDWADWKRVRLPLSAFRKVRGGDWREVRSLALSTTGWDIEPLEDTDLFIDEIRLLEDLPEEDERPPEVVSNLEEDEVMLWSGLGRDTEHFTEGKCAGRWAHLMHDRLVHTTLDMDWTPYQYLEFDCYSEAPTGDRFICCILSMDRIPEKSLDYWAYIVQTDWQGWRHFQIPFRRLSQGGRPVGWDRVTGMHLYPNGWGMQPNPSPDTVLTFDNMHLTEGEPRAVPEGMVEDFEDGPWAWWWMDEGSVPPRAGEHCGQFPLHEGWRRAICRKPLTSDWRPHQRLRLWVQQRALDGEVLWVTVYGSNQRLEGEIPLDGEGWREAVLPLNPNPGEVSEIHLRIKGLNGNDEGIANRDLDPAAVLCLDDLRLE